MTSAKKLTHLPNLKNWLNNSVNKSADKKYYHFRLEENLDVREEIIEDLQILVHKAHEDARQRLRNAFDTEYSLDPLEEEPTLSSNTLSLEDFPRCLELQTLKGYFGEIMAAVIAENYHPLDGNWYVPAFPFRYHQSAYHEFERLRQLGGSARTIIGRFGDDMLAFQRDTTGRITHTLVCEAKCSAEHDQELIKEAHKKASEKIPKPIDCFQLAELLKDYINIDPEAEKWRQALTNLSLGKSPIHERCDLVSYVCGLPPVKADTIVIPTANPHKNYTAGRKLGAVEVHLHDVDGLIEAIYQVVPQPFLCDLTPEKLSIYWEKVVSYVPEAKQMLLSEHCCLLAFAERRIVVGVRSLMQFREVQRRKKDIRKALTKSGLIGSVQPNEIIDIRLKVQT